MADIPFVAPLDEPRYGQPVDVAPGVVRVIAENPSKFTYRGTGTYIVSASNRGPIVVVDPGPQLDSHRDALAAAIGGRTVAAILVTHCHSDHSPLSGWLKTESGAPTIAFGPHADPSAEDDEDLGFDEPGEDPESAPGGDGAEHAADEHGGQVEPKEAIDRDFVPDVVAADGEVVARLDGLTLRAVHTPGHTSNHLCFTVDEHRLLFSGDHVMGWSTTVVSPPDGDMTAYINSLRKVIGRSDATLLPTHGNPITDPQPYLAAYLAHRLEREHDVLELVRAGVGSVADIVDILYTSVPRILHKAARRSVLAHLVKLVEEGTVAVEDGGRARLSSRFDAV